MQGSSWCIIIWICLGLLECLGCGVSEIQGSVFRSIGLTVWGRLGESWGVLVGSAGRLTRDLDSRQGGRSSQNRSPVALPGSSGSACQSCSNRRTTSQLLRGLPFVAEASLQRSVQPVLPGILTLHARSQLLLKAFGGDDARVARHVGPALGWVVVNPITE